jgi:hypothetical protein
MSGFYRLMVVLSVLWVMATIGAEYISINVHNTRIVDEYVDCSRTATEKSPSERQAHKNYCTHLRDISTVSFTDDLSKNASDPFSWEILLTPIAVLLVLGYTVRWVVGGFQRNPPQAKA